MSISSKDVDAEMPMDRPDIMPSLNPTNIPHMLATLQLNQFLARLAIEMSVSLPCSRCDEEALGTNLIPTGRT